MNTKALENELISEFESNNLNNNLLLNKNTKIFKITLSPTH